MLRVCLLLALAATPSLAEEEPSPRLSVLIVDGMNNHDWPRATRILKGVLESSGRFTVDVSTSPTADAPQEAWDRWRPQFTNYDVILSNFNGGHKPTSLHWPKDTAVRCIGFQTMLIRGCQWAATGEVTYPVPEEFPTATERLSGKFSRLFWGFGRRRGIGTGAGPPARACEASGGCWLCGSSRHSNPAAVRSLCCCDDSDHSRHWCVPPPIASPMA